MTRTLLRAHGPPVLILGLDAANRWGNKMCAQGTLAIIASLIILVGCCSDAKAAQWQTHVYKDNGFSVDFSGDVFEQPTDVTAGRATQYIQDGGTFAYFVTATIFENDFDFDSGVDRGTSSLKCAVIDSDISPASSADRNREIHGSNCNGGVSAGVAYFLVGKRFYHVMYLIPNASDPTDAEHFLHSFTLIRGQN